MNDMPLKSIIENGKLIISVGLDVLEFAAKNLPGFEDYEIYITNIETLAQEVIYALNEENEDGSTPISRLLDGAIVSAIENGAEGIELESKREE